MNESRARIVIRSRSGGECEAGCGGQATDAAHRSPRSHGGRWSPANLLHLCHACHMASEAHPELSERAGWRLESGGVDPESVPVLMQPAGFWPGWWRLLDDGLFEWVDPDGVTLPEPLDGRLMLGVARDSMRFGTPSHTSVASVDN